MTKESGARQLNFFKCGAIMRNDGTTQPWPSTSPHHSKPPAGLTEGPFISVWDAPVWPPGPKATKAAWNKAREISDTLGFVNDLSELPSGWSGMACFKATTRRQSWHLKLPDKALSDLQYERSVARWAGQVGLGPRIFPNSTTTSAIVSDFLDAQALSPRSLLNHDVRKKVFVTLNAIHSSTPPIHTSSANGILDGPRSAYDSCLLNGGSREIYALWEHTEKIARSISKRQRQDCLCHGDFHPGNLIYFNKSIWAVDWSSTHRGDPYRDLARFATLSGMEINDAETILTEYGGPFSSNDVVHLQQNMALFDADYALFTATLPALESYVSYFRTRVEKSRQLMGNQLCKT